MKLSQESVGYTDNGTDEEHCSICEFTLGAPVCALVQSPIKPGGWCRKFMPDTLEGIATRAYGEIIKSLGPEPAPDMPDELKAKDLWGQMPDGTKVYVVSGEWVRDNVDPDFTDYGEPAHDSYVPDGEIWVDDETFPGEVEFMAHSALIERQRTQSGHTYDLAHEEVDAESLREREASGDIDLGVENYRNVQMADAGPFQVWVVDGEAVRDRFDPDFIYGGHGLVYPFIPPDEIWLEDTLADSERPAILLHELCERLDMQSGMPYKPAHRHATGLEVEARRDPAIVWDLIAAEVARAERMLGDTGLSTVKHRILEVLKAAGLYDRLEMLVKDQPTPGDAHATTAIGNEDDKKKKPPKPKARTFSTISSTPDAPHKDVSLNVDIGGTSKSFSEVEVGGFVVDGKAVLFSDLIKDVTAADLAREVTADHVVPRAVEIYESGDDPDDPDAAADQALAKCPLCKGSGMVGTETCKLCDGEGTQPSAGSGVYGMGGGMHKQGAPEDTLEDKPEVDPTVETLPDCRACGGTGRSSGVAGQGPHCTVCGGSGVRKVFGKPRKEASLNKRMPGIATADFDIRLEITKTDAEQRLVFGWASVVQQGDRLVVDKQEDMITPQELEKAVYDYCEHSREMDDLHDGTSKAQLVESFVFTPEKAALGFVFKNETGEHVYGWFAGWRVTDDELWSLYKAGKRPELSIGGSSLRIPV